MPVPRSTKRPLSVLNEAGYTKRSNDATNAALGLEAYRRRPSTSDEYNHEFPGDLAYLRYRGEKR